MPIPIFISCNKCGKVFRGGRTMSECSYCKNGKWSKFKRAIKWIWNVLTFRIL